MKNILVIGASSFIGLNLIKKIRQNALIYATYNSTKKLVRKKNIKFFQFNLYNPNFNNIPENIDCIIFLAHPIIQGTDKLKLFYKNLNIIRKKLLLKKFNRLIYISSGSVYETGKVKSLNARSKINAEKILCNLNKKKIIILRIFFPYGKNQKNRMLPNLINNLKSKNKVNILQNSYKIYPTHVSDIVKVIIKVMKNKNIKGIFNVYNPKERMSMHDICKMILGKKIINKSFNFKKIKKLKINHTHQNLLENSNIKLFKLELKNLLR